MRTADAVIDRIKKVLGHEKDADLSKALKIPKTTISGWRGRNAPPYELCVQIADDHGASIDWLLTGEGPPLRDRRREEVPAQGDGLSPGETAVLALYRALDGDAQREIQTVAEEKKRLREVERQLKVMQADLASRKRSA